VVSIPTWTTVTIGALSHLIMMFIQMLVSGYIVWCTYHKEYLLMYMWESRVRWVILGWFIYHVILLNGIFVIYQLYVVKQIDDTENGYTRMIRISTIKPYLSLINPPRAIVDGIIFITGLSRTSFLMLYISVFITPKVYIGFLHSIYDMNSPVAVVRNPIVDDVSMNFPTIFKNPSVMFTL